MQKRLLIIVTGLALLSSVLPLRAAEVPDEFRVKREAVFEFAQKPFNQYFPMKLPHAGYKSLACVITVWDFE